MGKNQFRPKDNLTKEQAYVMLAKLWDHVVTKDHRN
ncbi:hypothetical protein RE628_06820 [Paenibacillus sp. D2_2]|nr:hypothetical protein [Paenibacillus sp. D2_2]WMT42129.1 hypothetical protein RE628_06820 [Paenibacillus sp. D2_2]